jgi:hypothetical protein
MSPFDGKGKAVDPRLARFRQLADLLRRNGASDTKMRGAIAEIDTLVQGTVAAMDARLHQTRGMIAEVDAFLHTAKTGEFVAHHPHRIALADDLREESRLCLEEARASTDMEIRRAAAWRAVDLAMLGEQAARKPAKDS